MWSRYCKIYNIEKTLLPSLFSIIRNIPETCLQFNNYEGVKHPGAILTRATEEIVKSALRTIKLQHKIYERRQQSKKKEYNGKEIDDFLKEMHILIGHYDSFQDECYLILKGLCPPPANDKAKGVKTVNTWLKKNCYSCGNKFLDYTGSIQKFIDMFSNKLKHGNQRFYFSYVDVDSYNILGFFIDDLKGNEIQKLYPWISTSMSNEVVAFSFNHFIKLLILCFYKICDSLANVIKEHIIETYKEDLNLKQIEKHGDIFQELILSIANLPNVFYPYEHNKYVKITISGKEVKISSPHSGKIPYSRRLNIGCMYSGDGYTKNFPLPVVS